jgi:hypothetical protein
VRAAGQVPSSVCDAEDFLILYNQNEEIASE